MGRASSQIDLTKGPTFRNLILFSLPIVIQGSFQITYNLVDRFWVGKLGKEAMAAVSVGFPVMFFVISMVIGIATGTGIMIAQYRGAREKGLVNLTARNFIVFGGLVVLVLSTIMLLSADEILRLLGTPPDFFDDAVIYLRWIFGGLIFMFSYNGATGIFRGLGDSATPTKVAAVSTCLNIIFDPFFIFGLGPLPALGVQGAAMATVLANFIGAVIIFVLLARQREWLDLSPRGFSFDWRIIRDMLRLGLPATATMMIVSSSVMVVMRFVNGLGTAAVAAYGIGVVLDSLIMMFAQSFAMAMSTITGQNIGAGKSERIGLFLRDTLKVSVGVAIVFGLFLVLNIGWIGRVFQPDEADYRVVFPLLKVYIRIMALRYLMMSMFFPINGTIRGAGDTMASMFLTIITQLVVRIPIVVVLVPVLGFAGVAWGLAASTVFGFLIVSVYYRTGIWKRRALITREPSGLDHGVLSDSPD